MTNITRYYIEMIFENVYMYEILWAVIKKLYSPILEKIRTFKQTRGACRFADSSRRT